MHHGTCVTHVPWCMSGSLTYGDGENVPGIPGACAPAISRIWQEAHGSLGIPEIYSKVLLVTVYYITPCFFFIGLIGNFLTYLVFMLKQYRGKVHAMLYRKLALVDTLVLIFYDGFHSLPKQFGHSIMTYNDLSCKVIPTIYIWLRALSAWILVIIGLERFVGVLFPLKARIVSNIRNFHWILLFTTSVLIALYAPLFVTSGITYIKVNGQPSPAVCSTSMKGNPCFWYSDVFYHWMNLIMACLLPFFFIIAFNIAIVFSIFRAFVRRKRMVVLNATVRKKTKIGPKVATLLTVSVTFILFSLPNPVIFLLERDLVKRDQLAFIKVVLISAILPVFDTINHAINLAFYCLCDRKFRAGLKSILCCFHVPMKLWNKLNIERRNDDITNRGSYELNSTEQTSGLTLQ